MKTGKKKNNQNTDGNTLKHENRLSDDILAQMFQKYNEKNRKTRFCEKTHIAIAYALNELTGKEKEDAKLHILKCKACLNMVLDVRAAEADAAEKADKNLQMSPDVAAAMHSSSGLKGAVYFNKIRTLIKNTAFAPTAKTHKLVAGLAAAVLILCVVTVGLHNRLSPVSVQIGLIATIGHSVPGNAGTVRGSDGEADLPKDPETYVLEPGGVLKTGDYFKIKIHTDKKAYVYLLLHNEGGSTLSPIYSGMTEAGKDKIVPQDLYGIKLGPYIGIKTIFLIVSKKEIKDFDQKTSIIKNDPILDSVRNIFPHAHIEQFSFHHEPED